MKCLAIDIGASSGRHIVGWREGENIETCEVYRFPNGMVCSGGHLTWDMDALLGHVREGIDAALKLYPDIESFSIDTWAVDYALIRDGKMVPPVFAYRDARTDQVIDRVHMAVPFERLYSRTGCQFQPFNTVYQLFDDLEQGRLDSIDQMLMVPEYLMYALTGRAVREYTNATTTGLVNAGSGKFDLEIIDALGLPKRLFPELSRPGEIVGEYRGMRCILCATHDTASAVEGIPMEDIEPYISSGTWSLLGVKTPKPITDAKSRQANLSNEGGVGYNRYQKNIMGMWLVNQLQREMCPDVDIRDIVREAEESRFDGLVDANSPEFTAPESMKEAFDKALGETPGDRGSYFRCAYRSIAACYAQSIRELEENTGCTYKKLYIVGGGAKNAFLNGLTRESTGKEVIALPIEATAIGNLKIQLEVCK